MSSTTPGNEPERPRVDEREPSAAVPDSAVDEGDTGSYEAPTARRLDESPTAADAAEPSPRSGEVETEPPVSTTVPDTADSDESVNTTARLDAAVERANAAPPASGIDDATATPESTPDPVAADSVRRETYVPSATVAAGTAAGAATLAPEPEPYVAPTPQTIYVQAPTPPKAHGNRGFGVLVALIGTVLFALLYAGVAYLLVTLYGALRDEGVQVFTQFLIQPVFWVPVVAFFIGFALLAAIVNRGPWWYYAVFGLLVGVLVYFAYLGGSLLTVQAWTLSVDQAADFINQRWLDPFAIVAFVIAREIPIWLGGWIAARGRAVAERDRLALEAYDRELAAGPQPQRY
ncbi:MAG: hypothetical protein M3Y52_01035 [Actinomycetota bacterium]|nr:hypothetical protein [Actinomycetota bacterium]